MGSMFLSTDDWDPPAPPIPIGAKIRFLKIQEQIESGDIPGLVFANPGDEGKIVAWNEKQGFMVQSKSWSSSLSFSVKRTEFEVLTR